jgi:hypothetical protein
MNSTFESRFAVSPKEAKQMNTEALIKTTINYKKQKNVD